MKILTLFFTVFCFSLCFADQPSANKYSYATLPESASEEDSELKNLQWNRYVVGNYVILSIDEKQGRWLCDNIEKISDSTVTRWGLQKKSLSKECRIFCVPNKNLLKKLFNIDESKAEVRKNEDGSVQINVIWIHLDSLSDNFIFPYISHVTLSNENLPFWFYRGAEILSLPIDNIKIKEGILNSKFSNCKNLFFLSKDEYLKLSLEEKEMFDQNALAVCLMLRKELGQKKLLSFIGAVNNSNPNIESSLSSVYGYKNLKEFDSKYNMYCNNLINEIKLGNVPNYYFLIKPFIEGDN